MSDEVSAVICRLVLLHIVCFFPLAAFKIFSLSFGFSSFTMMCLGVVLRCFLFYFVIILLGGFTEFLGSVSRFFPLLLGNHRN